MNRILFVLIALLAIGACGDDSGGGTDARRVDAPPPPDGPINCKSAQPNYGTITIADMDQGAFGGDVTAVNSTGNLTMANYTWQALLANNSPQIALVVMDFWEGYGAFAGAEGVHTGAINISGDELSLADCGLCTVLYADLTIMDGMITAANEIYFQTGGSVNLTAVPTGNHRPAVADGGFVADAPVAPDGTWGAMTGTIMNMTFGEINDQGDLVSGGCQTGITSGNINDPSVERSSQPGKRDKGKYGPLKDFRRNAFLIDLSSGTTISH
jgi:hypothetical protein